MIVSFGSHNTVTVSLSTTLYLMSEQVRCYLVIAIHSYYFWFIKEPKIPLVLSEINKVDGIEFEAKFIEFEKIGGRKDVFIVSFVMGVESNYEMKGYFDGTVVSGATMHFNSYVDIGSILGKYDLFAPIVIENSGSEKLYFIFSDKVNDDLSGKKLFITKIFYRLDGESVIREQETDFSIIL